MDASGSNVLDAFANEDDAQEHEDDDAYPPEDRNLNMAEKKRL